MTQPGTPPRVCAATILAGDLETHYLRVGTGPTVLVVNGDPEQGQAVLDALTTELAGRCRLVIPRLPASLRRCEGSDCLALTEWLRGLLDGLGLAETVVLVMDDRLRAPVAELARQEPDRVRGMAMSSRDCLTFLS